MDIESYSTDPQTTKSLKEESFVVYTYLDYFKMCFDLRKGTQIFQSVSFFSNLLPSSSLKRQYKNSRKG